jgi:hypothetical protein
MFCCTTPRDVIFAEWYFVNVISMTGILQHAVVCRVTAGSVGAGGLEHASAVSDSGPSNDCGRGSRGRAVTAGVSPTQRACEFWRRPDGSA